MRKPNPSKLKLSNAETKHIRTAINASKSVKITINIDTKTLEAIRKLADESGIPYQRLINRILGESLAGVDTVARRIERLEKDLSAIKRKLAA